MQPTACETARPIAAAVLSALRPSEYTSALIQVLRAEPARIRGAHVLELGCGSGVVLAALGALGAASLCGVDIEPGAMAASTRLLGDIGLAAPVELHQGDMWQPVAGRRFDLIVANLPHFPMEPLEVAGRLSTWSAGGANGRSLLDPFLTGLSDHLAAGGRAVITHNAFDDLAQSRALLATGGFSLTVALTTLVYISPEKVARMTADVLRFEEGRTVHRYGPYSFGEFHIVEIAAGGAG